ncbi:MAG: four helix bundle protein [Candidatus Omnitrophota bacterium]
MTNKISMIQANNSKYDLRERTAKFGENVINFAKRIPESTINRPLISQLVRAATSVGANYCEADDATTKKDFLYRIAVCRKESKESKHWLRMVTMAIPALKDEANLLSNEAQELNLIFSAIINKGKAKS